MDYLNSYESIREEVEKLNLIDDVLFQKVMEDKEACEEMLQTILGMPDLQVVENRPQESLRNIGDRSVILDVYCTDAVGNKFDVEMQAESEKAPQKRMRYNLANIDTRNTETGIGFDELPDLYGIYIGNFDVFKRGKTVYHIDRVLRDAGSVEYNGVHEIYLSTKGKDSGPVTDLLRYFTDSNGFNDRFPKLSKMVQYYKTEKEGILKMGSKSKEIFDKGVQEGKQAGILEGKQAGILEGKQAGILEGKLEGKQESMLEMAIKMLKGGELSIDKIAVYSGLPIAKIQELANSIYA